MLFYIFIRFEKVGMSRNINGHYFNKISKISSSFLASSNFLHSISNAIQMVGNSTFLNHPDDSEKIKNSLNIHNGNISEFMLNPCATRSDRISNLVSKAPELPNNNKNQIKSNSIKVDEQKKDYKYNVKGNNKSFASSQNASKNNIEINERRPMIFSISSLDTKEKNETTYSRMKELRKETTNNSKKNKKSKGNKEYQESQES